ncbi:MAG: 4-hydroxy-3-methylbut-2-enyl diphosphate reductase [Candidatus Omnitrophica bacterium CG11_big_fil_rev_8_21_14_0_20_64_10]|nr:MAG: 4-hydroxy-3-methylbut-2-enyl diphosphate reductase [Candidatus Omnitrophica bacterium CG11_big_fil_rev_8_21_14_0_20_64_10]
MSESNEIPIFRRGFGLKEQVREDLAQDYRSRLIEEIRSRGNRLQVGDLTILLAKEFGFCYGVERAVDYAYETKKQFPQRRVFLTTELIHNPRVNNNLREMGIGFLNGPGEGDCSIDDLTPQDVVIIAAFGTQVPEMDRLQKKGCVLVDATCGSVVLVWKRVEQYGRDGFTAIVHGNYKHEETRATVSRATQFPQGRYLVVWDKPEAQRVCDYIRTGKDKAGFLKYFDGKCSEGFDPDRDLLRVGVANQTTMLSSDSLEIGAMLKRAMADRYGAAALGEHFRSFDTICSATQDRQDAMLEMVKQKLDLAIIIGGFNSSNTGHLCEIASQYCPAYHIDEASGILSDCRIRHKPVGRTEPIVTEDWLPAGKLTIGVTAGASTPNRVIGDAIERLLEIRGYALAEEGLVR